MMPPLPSEMEAADRNARANARYVKMTKRARNQAGERVIVVERAESELGAASDRHAEATASDGECRFRLHVVEARTCAGERPRCSVFRDRGEHERSAFEPADVIAFAGIIVDPEDHHERGARRCA